MRRRLPLAKAKAKAARRQAQHLLVMHDRTSAQPFVWCPPRADAESARRIRDGS
jgi:hypothetical protein